MAFGNVIPIDEDVARQLVRRQLRFRRLAAALAAVWLSLLVPTLLFTPLPPIAPFAMFAVLVVLAEHRFVLFGDETSMSASIIVIVASIFVFADTSPLAAPMLIASLGGLYLPHLRIGSRLLGLANVSIFGMSAAIAAASSSAFTHDRSGSVLVAGAIVLLATCSYWYANSVLTGCASAVRNGDGILASVSTQASSEWPFLFLAVAAGMFGLSRQGSLAEFALVAALVLVFELSVRRHRAWTSVPLAATSGAFLIGISSLLAITGVAGAALAAVGAFLFTTDANLLRDRAGLKASVGILTATTAIVLSDGSAPALHFIIATALAMVVTSSFEVIGQRDRHNRRLPLLVVMGLSIPSRTDVALVAIVAGLLLVSGTGATVLIGALTIAVHGAMRGRTARTAGHATALIARRTPVDASR